MVAFGLITLMTTAIEADEYDSFTDKRDGNVYKIVKIGRETWMAENMRYISDKMDYKLSKISSESGYLYKFGDAQKVCPAGWHLPTRVEFDRLLAAVCTAESGSDNLRHTKWEGGKNISGFAALPAGKCEKTGCSFFDTEAYFWSSTERSRLNAYNLCLDKRYDFADMRSRAKDDAYSVRCVKD